MVQFQAETSFLCVYITDHLSYMNAYHTDKEIQIFGDLMQSRDLLCKTRLLVVPNS